MNFKKFKKPMRLRDLRDEDLIVGRVLRAADGKIALVGDMNDLGGACDDCTYGGEWIEYSDDLVPLVAGER